MYRLSQPCIGSWSNYEVRQKDATAHILWHSELAVYIVILLPLEVVFLKPITIQLPPEVVFYSLSDYTRECEKWYNCGHVPKF